MACLKKWNLIVCPPYSLPINKRSPADRHLDPTSKAKHVARVSVLEYMSLKENFGSLSAVKQVSMIFGGEWTQQKLDILENYLDAYTTVLKNKPFKLMYIDAFAGTGRIAPVANSRKVGSLYGLIDGDSITNNSDDLHSFVSGSAERAIKVTGKPFDKFIFVEKYANRCAELENLREAHPGKNIQVINSDANQYLSNMAENWSEWRGVLFLDPFATEVKWSTIETVAKLNALDTWILFPTHAVMRMLPRAKMPDGRLADRLTEIYGDESWKNLYRRRPSLFGDEQSQRQAGAKGLVKIYKENLNRLFNERFLSLSRPLKNSNNGPLFEFIFCAGHPKGADVAKKIAKHLVENI